MLRTRVYSHLAVKIRSKKTKRLGQWEFAYQVLPLIIIMLTGAKLHFLSPEEHFCYLT